jgi:RNA polymerase sigma-70 factor (ECF subfamily)
MTEERPDPFQSIRAEVAGKRLAYLETVEPHRGELFRFARALTASPWDAEDLVQEALMRVFSGLGTYSGRVANLRAYLFRVVTNCWIDQQRRSRPALLPPSDLEAPRDQAALGPEVREALERIVAGLPPRERAAVLLKETFGFSLKDIAAALRTTPGAVKAALHRGRQKLASLSGSAAHLPEPVPDVVDAWVEAFNRRDVEGLLALMAEDCQVVIPGVVDDAGPEMARSVLTHTIAEETLLRAERVAIEGKAVIALWYRVDDAEAIGDAVLLDAAEGRVTRLRSYYYSPDVLEAVAAGAGARARTQGYRM